MFYLWSSQSHLKVIENSSWSFHWMIWWNKMCGMRLETPKSPTQFEHSLILIIKDVSHSLHLCFFLFLSVIGEVKPRSVCYSSGCRKWPTSSGSAGSSTAESDHSPAPDRPVLCCYCRFWVWQKYQIQSEICGDLVNRVQNVCIPHCSDISPLCFLHSSSSKEPKARPKHLFYKYSFTNNVMCLFADKQIVLSIHLEVSSKCEMTVSYIQLSEWERVTHWSVYGYARGRGCGCQLAVNPEWRLGPGGCVALTMYKIIRRPPLSFPRETARHAWQAFKEPPLKTPRGKGHQNNLEELRAHCHPCDSQTEYLNGVLMVLNRKGWGNQGSEA